MFKRVRMRIDGLPLWVDIRAGTERLSGSLRSLAKTGRTSDCGDGQCGACIVIIGDRPVKSCLIPAENCAGADIWTADHLDYGPSLHPMLRAFRNHGVPACEVCMPGLLVAAIAYATCARELTDEEVAQDLVADVCRCPFAGNIVAAVVEGARDMHRLRPMDTG